MGYPWWKDVDKIAELARSKGLDFYEVTFEEITKKMMVELGTYILPYRYRHWTFGQEYGKMQKFHDLGILEILEMVVNSNPAKAYLLDSNTPTDHKMVIAHVFAHVDFFKHNYWFSKTDRKMIEKERYFESRVKELAREVGEEKVEELLDILIPIQWYVDYFGQFSSQKSGGKREEKDLLLYLIQNAPIENWQSEIIEFIRQESLYFIPNAMTKIMNEGWATYWHTEMMRDYLTFEEFDAFAIKHAKLMSSKGLNPYKLGYMVYTNVRRRWDERYGEGAGLKKIFEIREFEDDTSLIRNYLTEDIVKECGLYLYEEDPETGQRRVKSTNIEEIKAYLIGSIQNMGKPVIVVLLEDSPEREELVKKGKIQRSHDLLLKHRFDGRELDLDSAADVLKSMHQLWKNNVHLLTVVQEKRVLLTCDGEGTHLGLVDEEEELEKNEKNPEPNHSGNNKD